MPSPLVRALRTRNPWRVGLLVLCLLFTFPVVPFLADYAPMTRLAEGAEQEEAATQCVAFGVNWTACGNAAASDDIYATADAAPLSFVRAGGVTGTFFSFDIGSPATGRLVVVFADDESTGTSLTDVTVDSNSCNLVTEADNPSGTGNHQEMWYCDEDELGSSGGLVTIAIMGGDSGWGVHAHLHTGVSQTGPTDIELNDTAAGVSTIEVANVTTPAAGLVVFGAGHGLAGTFVGWTPPLAERTDFPDPTPMSARLGTASGIESSPQTNKTYIATTSSPFNRGTGIVAVWPSEPARNDTAWSNFGLNLSTEDLIDRVEVGVEWYRLDARSILNVTVSWDGGSTWAPNQRATNKSVDDDTVNFLNFTSATMWNPMKLNDANLRVRVGTNYSGARLDFLTVRVNYNLPAVDLTLVSSSSIADPGDILTLNATVENLGPGTAHNFLLEASVDANASYRASSPVGIYDAGMRTVQWTLSLLSPGEQGSFEWTVRVIPGTPDFASVNTSFRVTYENVTGSPLPPLIATAQTTVQVPVFDPVLNLDRSEAEREDVVLAILYYNNTGSGRALRAWANWSLDGHYALMDIFPAQTTTLSAEGFDIWLTDVDPGAHSLVARLRVIRGLEDGLNMEVRVAWSLSDGNGNLLPGAGESGSVSLLAPSFTLDLRASDTSVQVGSDFILDVTVRNEGRAEGWGWLNMTLPPGAAYVSQDGTLEVTASAGLVSWRIASLSPTDQVRVQVRLRVNDGPSLESFVLSVDFTDRAGTPPLTVFSDQVFVRFLGGSGAIPLPWWIFLLPLLVPVVFAAYYLNRRFRHPELRIEEVFVIHRKGILVAHQSRTLTPDKDRDILAAMFKAVQGFVQEAFAQGEEGSMRGLRFENFNILIEQGTHHYVAVVYQGQESRLLARRVATMSQTIEAEFGALLAAWVGDMNEMRGIRTLLPLIWGESAGAGTKKPPHHAVRTITPLAPAPSVEYRSIPGKLFEWLPVPFRGAHRLLRTLSIVMRALIRSKGQVPSRLIDLARRAMASGIAFVRNGGRGRLPPRPS